MPQHDDTWMDALRGKGSSSETAPPDAVHLRAVIAAADQQLAPADDEPQRLARLLFRLRRERLMDAAPRTRRPAAWAATAVVVLGTALTFVITGQLDRAVEDTVVRGAGNVQILQADDPRAAATRIEDVLKDLGAKTTVVPADPAPGQPIEINATVGPEAISRARAELAPLGVALPADGRLSVVIEPSAR